MGVLGFTPPSRFDSIEHYEYGDVRWHVNVSPLGSGSARYSNLHAQSFFGLSAKRGDIRAEDYVNHPGDIRIFARLHLALGEQSQVDRYALDSKQVHDLIGELK